MSDPQYTPPSPAIRDSREQIAALAHSLRLWRNLSLGLCGFTLAIVLVLFVRSGSSTTTITSPASSTGTPQAETAIKELQDRIAQLEAAKASTPIETPEKSIAGSDVISARRFEVKGKAGRVQAVFEATADGSTSVRLLNEKGDAVLSMAASDKGAASLTVADAAGRPRCVVTVLDNGTPRVVLTDARGAERLSAMIDQQGSSHLVFFDQAGRNRGSLSAPADAAPGLYLRDTSSNLRAALSLIQGNRAALTFFDDQQRLRAEFRVADGGSAALEIADKAAKTRALLATTSDGEPVLRLSDDKDQILFTAPK